MQTILLQKKCILALYIIICTLTFCGCAAKDTSALTASMTETGETINENGEIVNETDETEQSTASDAVDARNSAETADILDNEKSTTASDMADNAKSVEASDMTASEKSDKTTGTTTDSPEEDISDSTNTADASDHPNETNRSETSGTADPEAASEPSDMASASAPTLLAPAQTVKGIYVTGPVAGSERMQGLIELVETTELNAMVIDIKNDEGNLTYKMTLPPEQDMDAGVRYVRDMPELIRELHEKGIYVIGRIVCFKDPILSDKRTELALCKPDGTPIVDANGLSWVNPYKEDVWDYLCTIAECASADGFDEIQFDYIRFPIGSDAEEADYGVDLDTYTREMGLQDFFSYTQKRLHEKNIIFGADLFGTVIGSDEDRDRTGQNYLSIAESCDVLCPMIYPSHYAAGTFNLKVPDAYPYETIHEALELSKKVLSDTLSPQQAVIRPWLQCFNAIWVNGHITYDSAQVAEEIKAVYDTGHEEWILWNASNHYEQVADALASLQENTE